MRVCKADSLFPKSFGQDNPELDCLWDQPLAQTHFAFVDLEMTGLDPERDRICELCVLRTLGTQPLWELESLVHPDVRVGGNAVIHGLDQQKLAGAPGFAKIANEVVRALEGAIVVAHAAAHDIAFLKAALHRVGLALPLEHALDTLPLARRCFALPSYRLETLAAHLAIGLDHPHRAGDDARATLALFWKMVEMLAPTTPRDLLHVRVGEKHARPEILGRALLAVQAGAPVMVRYRPSRKPVEELRMVFTQMRTDLDPPRVMGYLDPGRGRRELRADRILAISPTH